MKDYRIDPISNAYLNLPNHRQEVRQIVKNKKAIKDIGKTEDITFQQDIPNNGKILDVLR